MMLTFSTILLRETQKSTYILVNTLQNTDFYLSSIKPQHVSSMAHIEGQ